MENPSLDTAALWEQFRGQLLRFLRHRLPDETDAEDVLQEIFLRLHESTSRPCCDEKMAPWLYGIARRAVVDFYRARGRRPAAYADAFPEVEEAVASDEQPADPLADYAGLHDVHEEVLSWLRPMIEELPERYRVPLRMADVEGKTQQEVADALGLSLSGAKSRVQRGRAMLGELLHRCCDVAFGPEGRAVAFRRLRPSDDPCYDGCT